MPQPAHAIAASPTPHISVFAPLRHRSFLFIWLAALVSNFGSLIQSVGASWMMTTIAGSADMVALVQASTTLPIMLFSLPAGAVADSFDRRHIMIAAQAFMLLVSATLAAVAYLGLITPWLLLTLTFLIGCGAALNGPAWQASVGEQVPREDLPAAVALNSISYNIARSLGPAIGGAIVAAVGAAAAFLVNALSYVALIAVLIGWRRPVPERHLPREPLGAAMASGLRYVALSPTIGRVLMRGLAFGVTGSAVWALMALIARERLSGGPLTYGLILGAFGVGAVLGAFASTRLRQRMTNEMLVRSAMVAFGVGTIIAGVSQFLSLTMAALLLCGGGWVLALSTFNVTVQLSAPRWVVARALAVYQMATFGGLAIGSWIWGSAAEYAGLVDALVASGVTVIASAALGLWFGLPQSEELDLAPSGHWAEPDLKVDVDPRSGPVVVTIEYRIDAADAVAFQVAMAERRRIRRRDGAHDWSLLQDVAQPERWIERFQSLTWVAHLRQHARVTVADRAIEGRVLSFHRSPEPPVVTHLIERPPGAGPLGTAALPTELPPGAISDPSLPPHRNGIAPQ
jgi:MFS family permease